MLAIDLHAHESCMHVAARVLHSCAFIMLINQYYVGRFYMRSEIIHKVPPDYCVGKSVLHGKILHKNFDLM